MRDLRHPTAIRRILVALAMFALAVRLAFPAGFMPGTSLARPLTLCSGQGPMPGMAMPRRGDDHRHHPGKAPHGGIDHDCPFAGLGAAPMAPKPPALAAGPTIVAFAAPIPAPPAAAPGRGLAAPPPPSHAPPSFHA